MSETSENEVESSELNSNSNESNMSNTESSESNVSDDSELQEYTPPPPAETNKIIKLI